MRIKKQISFLLLAIMSIVTLYAQPDLDEGKSIFKAKCAQCHNKNMKDKLTGPALGGVEERWADYPREDLYQWIRASQQLVQAGHPKAVELWSEWSPVVMNNFQELSDEQIESLLAYVDAEYNKVPEQDLAAAGKGAKDEGSNTTLLLWLLGGLALLAAILTQIAGTIRNVAKAKTTGEEVKPISLLSVITNKSVIGVLIFGVVVFAGYHTVTNAMNIGRQQGYAPDQPIKFSHETHAGLQQIDCKYCHDGARRSKHSVIPAANTCMNCHKAIEKGSKYGTGELTKIFASIGYNPLTDKYIENYESLSQEEVKAVYAKWISTNYLEEKGLTELDTRGESLVEEQIDGIVSSLTNDQKKTIQGPIEWIRIHNLPDHVYFNHSQHVTAGKLECQTCHGKVEEMEILTQHSPLSMGWCINCHRETKVAGMADNPYYANTYKTYHEAMEKGEMDKVTVEQIGGLECQKCHY